MLSREKLDKIAIMAELNGYRVRIESDNYVLFLYEYLPCYDILMAYKVTEGVVHFETSIEKKSGMTPEELKTLCDNIGLTLGLIKFMGGIDFKSSGGI